MRLTLLVLMAVLLSAVADEPKVDGPKTDDYVNVPVGTVRTYQSGDSTVIVTVVFNRLVDKTRTVLSEICAVNQVTKVSTVHALFCEECDSDGFWRGGVRGGSAHVALPGKLELGSKWNLRDGCELQITELARKVKVIGIEFECIIASDMKSVEVLVAKGVGIIRVTNFAENKETGVRSSTVSMELTALSKPESK